MLVGSRQEMHVRVCAMHVCVRAGVRVCGLCAHVCMCAHEWVCVCVRVRARVCVCMHACMHVSDCMCGNGGWADVCKRVCNSA